MIDPWAAQRWATIVLFFLAQRVFVEGVTLTGVKG